MLQAVELGTGQRGPLRITLQSPFSAFYPPVVGRASIAVFADEGEANADLNGDGDLDDVVAAVVQRSTASLRSTGLAVAGGDAAELDRGRWAFVVSEADSAGADFNADDDALDRIPFLYDPRAGSSISLGLASDGRLVANEHLVVLGVSEADEGATDFNGDGDAQDQVYAILDVESAELVVTRHVVGQNFFRPLAALSGPTAGLIVRETSVTGSLNGDTDQSDRVFFVFDGATRQFFSTGMATATFVGAPQEPAFAGFEGGFAFTAREAAQAVDLTGDGDTTDSVVHIVSLR